MNLRHLSAAACAAALAGGAAAAEPAKLPVAAPAAANQTLANTVSEKLTGSGAAENADLTVVVEGGVVTLTGTCASKAQYDKVVETVRNVPGVKKVRDGLSVSTKIVRVQDTAAAPQFGPLVTAPIMAQPPAYVGGPQVDPVPLGGSGGFAAEPGAPPLPPYAWPTYAPHNNVSRVAYPTAYPYNAFPFIGPYYPFPKVPLGWRKVTMEWEDGHWWIGKTQAPQDYWRVRFW